MARSPDHPNAFTRARKLPLPTLLAALLSFRGASVQSALDAFFPSLGAHGAGVLVSDRALAKARSKLHVPALWALNDRLIDTVQSQGQLHMFKGRRLVCADGTVLAPAQRACLRTRSLAAPVQRALGLYLPGNDLMLHVAVGPEAEGERQMLFDQLDRLRRGDVLILDRGYPASWLVQALAQRGIDFVIRCDSTQGWGAARDFLRSGHSDCWRWLSPCDAQQASTWELDGPACLHARLVRHVSSGGRTRVLVTSLSENVATVAELADLYHGRQAHRGGVQASEAPAGAGECQRVEPACFAGGCGHQGAGGQSGGSAQSGGTHGLGGVGGREKTGQPGSGEQAVLALHRSDAVGGRQCCSRRS